MKLLHHHTRLGEAVKRMGKEIFPETKLTDDELLVLANTYLMKYRCHIGYADEHKNVGIEFDSIEDEITFILKWS